nr:CZB domain-containing protein [Sulfurimonas sp. SAG-AH-194-I05]
MSGCRLGKWYYEGDGNIHFSNTQSYQKLEQPHEIVHSTTHKIFSILTNNDEENEYNKLLSIMETNSSTLFVTLDEILKEKA